MRKAKLLFIPSWFPSEKKPNEGKYFEEQISVLSENYDIKVLVGTTYYCSPRVFFKKFVQVLFDFKISYSSNSFPIEAFYFTAPFLYNRIKWINFNLINCAFRKAFKILHNRSGWIPDCIIIQSAYMFGPFGMSLARSLKIPYMLHEHQIPFFHSDYFNVSACNDAVKNANGFLCVSEYQANLFRIMGIRQDSYILPNFINLETLSGFREKRSSCESKTKRIVFISYDWYIKDNETFFNAIKYLLNHLSFHDFEVDFVGGSLDPNIENDPFTALPSEYGVADYFRIHGRLKKDETLTLISHADVLVSSSLSETHGLVIREALALGVPVVTTRNGGSDQLCSDPELAILCERKDFIALADGIKKVLEGTFTFNGEKAFKMVEAECGKTAFKNKFQNALNAVLCAE